MTDAVFSYLRVSSASQADGDGIERQRDAIRRYVNWKQFRVDGEFVDEGVSGALPASGRPKLLEVLETAACCEDPLILVERPDRLARDTLVYLTIIRACREEEITIRAVEGELDLTADDNPTAKMISQLFGALAHYQKRVFVENAREARERTKKTKGRCEGSKPFGYYEGEEAAYARILELASVEGPKKVARRLNDEGYKPRSGKKWHGATIHRIIKRAQKNGDIPVEGLKGDRE